MLSPTYRLVLRCRAYALVITRVQGGDVNKVINCLRENAREMLADSGVCSTIRQELKIPLALRTALLPLRLPNAGIRTIRFAKELL